MSKKSKWGLPLSVVSIVICYFVDYDRRKRAVEAGAASEDVLQYYKELNGIIDEALEAVEPRLRNDFFTDIKINRGYGYSPTSAYLCKNGYYARKRKVIYTVAVRCNLI